MTESRVRLTDADRAEMRSTFLDLKAAVRNRGETTWDTNEGMRDYFLDPRFEAIMKGETTYVPFSHPSTESERAGSSMTFDITQHPHRVLWRAIFQFVGGSSYLSVAGTCQEFRTLYREEYDEPRTSAEELVQTVAGAELFLRETSDDDKFCIEKEEVSMGPLTPVQFIHFAAALSGRVAGAELFLRETSEYDEFYIEKEDTDLTMRGLSPVQLICFTAALSGRLEVLQWSLACLDDFLTCFCAAYGGHLSVLQWLRAHGCPWDETVVGMAAEMGHLNIVQWAHVNGCPCGTYTYSCAIHSEQWTVVQWLRANGCPED